MNERRARSPRLIFVHHANQYLITDGYENRQGLSEIAQRYALGLSLHEKYELPFALHLSGTLLEALAWQCPWFLAFVKSLWQKGLMEWIGGAYGENILPLFSQTNNEAQLFEYLSTFRACLGDEVPLPKLFWLPERVWDTEKLAETLSNPQLPNGGYKGVFIDDRLFVSPSERSAFDQRGPYQGTNGHPEGFRPARIEGGRGLIAYPISSWLRYALPPQNKSHFEKLEQFFSEPGSCDSVFYADDLEKTCGTGGWDPHHLEAFENVLRWIQEKKISVSFARATSEEVVEEISAAPGTFYELENTWGAKADYSGFWNSADFSLARESFAIAQRTIEAMKTREGSPDLLKLAQKHFLACQFETAWRDTDGKGTWPAPWALALAHRAKAVSVMDAADRWFQEAKGNKMATLIDVDGDGEKEIVLANSSLFAVLTSHHGGRIVWLFARTAQHTILLIGNPTDDWNFQKETNSYMRIPANHPGALSEKGFENSHWKIDALEVTETDVLVRLKNEAAGYQKTVRFPSESLLCELKYETPIPLSVEVGLSPDYLSLLKEGRNHATETRTRLSRALQTPTIGVSLEIGGEGTASFGVCEAPYFGHGFRYRLEIRPGVSQFRLRVEERIA